MIEALQKIWEKLDPQRVFLAALLGGLVLVFLTMYEQRTILFNEIRTSTALTTVLTVGCVIVITTAIAYLFVRSSEQSSERLLKSQEDRIKEGQKHSANQDLAISRLSIEQENDRKRFTREIKKAEEDMKAAIEREQAICDKRIANILETMAANGIVDKRKNG